MTLNIMTLSIKGIFQTLSIMKQLSVMSTIMLSVIVLSIMMPQKCLSKK